MNKLKLLIGLSIVLSISAFALYKSINWKVKDDYSVTVYQGGTKFVSFQGLKAEIVFDEEHPEKSKISATINSNPIVKDNEALREGAKGPDVLNAEKFPVISFQSTAITKTNNGYEATGNLTLKDITKEIKLPFTFEKEIFKGGFTISPKDFEITDSHFQKDLNIVLSVPVTR